MRPLVLASLLAVMPIMPMRPAVAQEIEASRVAKAIQQGVDYLKRRQRADGSWEEWMNAPGGVTALCTLALLNSGVPPTDPCIAKALTRIRKSQLASTYVASLETMVLCRAEPSRDLVTIRRNVAWLERKQVPDGPAKGAWAYPVGSGDNSNAQFALLALHEAEQIGVEVSGQTWRWAKAYWEDCQNIDGSWGYQKGNPGTGSMTCAGIASLVIVRDRVNPADAQVDGDRIRCCGAQRENINDRLQNGLAWLGRNFSVTANPGSARQLWTFYYLYALERVGRMTAQRFIGGHDWYREGADFLVGKQDAMSGFWRGAGSAEMDEEIATSLVLLFLAKGRRPVVLAKLKHTTPSDWNQHRGDVANLTRYIESRWKRELTWQVVDLKAATSEDLQQTPVLYLCGSQSPLPEAPAEQDRLAQKLRDYLDRGGFLLAEAYCNPMDFDTGFRQLMTKIFPEPEYALRMLPAEHPAWYAEEAVDPNHLRPLLGVDFGCRTAVIYVPPDPPEQPRPSLSCLWELYRSGRDQSYSPAVAGQIHAAMALGANIVAYATNREVRGKDTFFPTVSTQRAIDRVERGKLYVATVQHAGGCGAAPRALGNLLNAVSRELRIRVDSQQRMLSLDDPAIFNHVVLFMHGRNSFRLNDTERKQLKTYLERGGVLFADSICASGAFTESFRREMAAILPEGPLKPIPADHAMWTPLYGGFDLKSVARRDPQVRGSGDPLKAAVHRVPPSLEGITLEDRYAVIFSPYDLSCALEKQDSLECQGYTREDAARIGINVLLYALQE